MRKPDRSAETGIDPSRSRTSRNPVVYFWMTIFFLAAVSAGLVFNIWNKSDESPEPVEIEPTILENWILGATRNAWATALSNIDSELDAVYAPALAAIPAYAEFHYSVLGQYTELLGAAQGDLIDALQKRLLKGFDKRFETAAANLDNDFMTAFRTSLQAQTGRFRDPENSRAFGNMTERVLQDAIDRVYYTYPLATVAAGIVGSGSLKVVATTIAKKVAFKVSAATAAKGAAKGGGVLVGAGSGALLCSWSGPGAAACGVVGGVVAWFVTDAVIVNIDEVLNRDDFEAELRQILLDNRAHHRAALESALAEKANRIENETTRTLKQLKEKTRRQNSDADFL